MRRALRKLKLDGLIVIGGDGSFRGADKLTREFDLPVVGVPATIDNDIPGTDNSIGYDTALNIAVDAVDKIKDTASSHGRIFVIEVMGRDYGLLAAQCAMATGAEETLVPELPYDVERHLPGHRDGLRQGKYHALIIVAEGAGRASQITYEINSRLNRPVRMVVLGHVQRGGAPTAFDRILATRIAHHAAELLLSGKHGVAVGIVANKFKTGALHKRSAASKRRCSDELGAGAAAGLIAAERPAQPDQADEPPPAGGGSSSCRRGSSGLVLELGAVALDERVGVLEPVDPQGADHVADLVVLLLAQLVVLDPADRRHRAPPEAGPRRSAGPACSRRRARGRRSPTSPRQDHVVGHVVLGGVGLDAVGGVVVTRLDEVSKPVWNRSGSDHPRSRA